MVKIAVIDGWDALAKATVPYKRRPAGSYLTLSALAGLHILNLVGKASYLLTLARASLVIPILIFQAF